MKKSEISIEYIPSEMNFAYVMTKPLGPKVLNQITTRTKLAWNVGKDC